MGGTGHVVFANRLRLFDVPQLEYTHALPRNPGFRSAEGALYEAQLGKPASDRFEYVDTRVEPGTSYRYLHAVGDGDGEFVSPIVTVTIRALSFALEQTLPTRSTRKRGSSS
jgi:hypothetical protein